MLRPSHKNGGRRSAKDPAGQRFPAADRIRPERIRAYAEHLEATAGTPSPWAVAVTSVYYAARLITADRDRSWQKAISGVFVPLPDRVWNRIPDAVRERIKTLALDEPALSPRERDCPEFCA